MELQAAATVISSLNGAFTLTKSFLEIQGTSKIQAKIIELQSQILNAQQSAMVAQQTQGLLLARVKELESEIETLKRWDADIDAYRLENVGDGSFAYTPKAEPTADQPNHWLCVNCFERNKQRSVLQNTGGGPDHGYATFGCPACKNTFKVHWSVGPQNRRPG